MTTSHSITDGMPLDLVLVRHGKSEANCIQKLETHTSAEQRVAQRADWQQRLACEGAEQARIAGAWLEAEFGGPIDTVFDKKYVSHFVRTTETALHLAGSETKGWRYDKRIVERSWGTFGATSREEQKEAFRRTVERREVDPLYTAVDGGEALATDVLLRWRNFVETLHREASGQRVLAVTHGELMWVARFDLERMLPEEWIELDSTQKIRNCAVLHYTRQNPHDPADIAPRLKWMRLIYPDVPSESPYDGEWQEIVNHREYDAADFEARLKAFPTYLSEET